MKKLIIKTIAITLAGIIVLVGLLFGLLALVVPKSLGNFFAGMGAYNGARTFYERQYNLNQDQEDLLFLVDYLNAYSDSEKTEEYSLKAIDSVEFSSLSDAEFYYGKFVVASFINGKISSALAKAVDFVDKFGYSTYNPFRTLIYDANISINSQDLIIIQSALINVEDKVLDQVKVTYDKDLSAIAERI